MQGNQVLELGSQDITRTLIPATGFVHGECLQDRSTTTLTPGAVRKLEGIRCFEVRIKVAAFLPPLPALENLGQKKQGRKRGNSFQQTFTSAMSGPAASNSSPARNVRHEKP